MFDAVADDESMGSLVDAQMVINFRLHDPDADIWVDGRFVAGGDDVRADRRRRRHTHGDAERRLDA